MWFPDVNAMVTITDSIRVDQIRNALLNFEIPEPGFIRIMVHNQSSDINRELLIRINGTLRFWSRGQWGTLLELIPVMPGDVIDVWHPAGSTSSYLSLPGDTWRVPTASFFPIRTTEGTGLVESENITQIRKRDNILETLVNGDWLEVTPYGLLNFLNIERGNMETMRTLARADAAQSPTFWTPGVVQNLRDTTFGIRHRGSQMLTSNQQILRVSIPIPPVIGFRLIDFGGTIFLADIGQSDDEADQTSANFGAMYYTRATNQLIYELRIFDFFKPQLTADIWVRYRTATSSELPLPPVVLPDPGSE